MILSPVGVHAPVLVVSSAGCRFSASQVTGRHRSGSALASAATSPLTIICVRGSLVAMSAASSDNIADALSLWRQRSRDQRNLASNDDAGHAMGTRAESKRWGVIGHD